MYHLPCFAGTINTLSEERKKGWELLDESRADGWLVGLGEDCW